MSKGKKEQQNGKAQGSKDKRTFDLEDRLIDFAVEIIHLTESLPKTKVGKHIAK